MDAEPHGIRDWMREVKADLARLDDKWQRSVDDMKATIRSEISDIKNEPIADLRRRIDEGYRTLEKYDERIRSNENAIREWKVGSSVLGWIVKTAIGAGGILVGYLGARHL